jgi:hypothetical protein
MAIKPSGLHQIDNPEPTDPCRALFCEADRLNEQAYALLDEPISTQALHKFSKAKKRAEEKYQEACSKWARSRKAS